MNISSQVLQDGRRLAPQHWLVGQLVVFSDDDDAKNGEIHATRVVATVTCREHFCVSLNGKWQAYASPDGSICVLRDNLVLVAVLQRTDPVIRIDYVDNETGAVWFCTQNDTWRRWIWAWNHGLKTVTQVNLIRGPDVTEEYKQRVFTALEDLNKNVSVYAYRKGLDEYWIHNDMAKPQDVKIGFEPTWYDLSTRSFVSLVDVCDDDDDIESFISSERVDIDIDTDITEEKEKTTTEHEEKDSSVETRTKKQDEEEETMDAEEQEQEQEQEEEDEEEEEEEREMLPA